MKCLACGSGNLVEGRLQGEDGSETSFQFSDTSWVKRIFAMNKRGVRAYGCMHCQHLQLAVDFTDRDREQYLKFEGRQPGVLERLSEED